MNKVRKSLTSAGLVVGLLAGGTSGVILSSTGIAGAQESTTTSAPATTAPDVPNRGERYDKHLRKVLAPLVTDGTLTEAQLDAVVARMLKAGQGAVRRHDVRATVSYKELAEVLGMTTKELTAALSEGKTLAEIAESKDMTTQELIDSMTAKLKSRIDKLVAEGRIDQARADELLEKATERANHMINNENLGDRIDRIKKRWEDRRDDQTDRETRKESRRSTRQDKETTETTEPGN